MNDESFAVIFLSLQGPKQSLRIVLLIIDCFVLRNGGEWATTAPPGNYTSISPLSVLPFHLSGCLSSAWINVDQVGIFE